MIQKELSQYYSDGQSNECKHCGRVIDNPGALGMHEQACVDGKKKEYSCANCGTSFEDFPSRRESRGRKTFYCSKSCKNEHESTGEYRNCSHCGTEVYKPQCHLTEMGEYGIDNHFCDKECEKQWKRKNWVRHDHPLWQGGKGGIDAVRNMLSQDSWHNTAREHRQSTSGVCKNCGESPTSRELDVHHIIPVAAGGTNGSWNFMTLCISCHRKAEKHIRKYTTPHLYKLVSGCGERPKGVGLDEQ